MPKVEIVTDLVKALKSSNDTLSKLIERLDSAHILNAYSGLCKCEIASNLKAIAKIDITEGVCHS